MASVLENYQVDVLALLRSGATYKSVCEWLAEKKGVNITKQSVCSWYVRKLKKILKREQKQNEALHLPTQSKNGLDPKVSLSGFPKSLNTLIQEGERQSANPHMQYIVRPKLQALTNKVSTLSKRVKK